MGADRLSLLLFRQAGVGMSRGDPGEGSGVCSAQGSSDKPMVYVLALWLSLTD